MQGILPQELLLNIFGDGSEYLWAFDAQEEEQEQVEQVVKKKIQSTQFTDENIVKLFPMFFFPIEELESSLQSGRRSYPIPNKPDEEYQDALANLGEHNLYHGMIVSTLVNQISSNAGIKRAFCETERHLTKLSVYPTDIGMREIDPFHLFYTFKYVKEKPISDFQADQIIYILNAVSQGLLYLEWHFEVERIKEHWRDEYFTGDDFDSDWATLRYTISDASVSKLIEYAKQYYIESLRGDAIQFVKEQCMQSLEDMADLKCPELLNDDSFILCIGHDHRNILAAIVNKDGFLVDSFSLCYSEHQSNNALNNNKAKTLDRVHQEYDIKGIICGGQGVVLKDAINFILNDGKKGMRGPLDVPMFFCIVGDYFARLKSYSPFEENVFVSPVLPKNAIEESQYSQMDRYLVSLGRWFINPTLEIASLFNKNKDYLRLNLHTWQHEIPEDVLYNALHSKLKDIVAKFGLDINYILHRPHLHQSLYFVKGIHHSRVNDIIATVLTSDDQVLYSRADLYSEDQSTNILTKEEFQIAAPILRIGEGEIEYADPLDDMRIHPSHYLIARKISSDALEEHEQEIDEQNPSKSVVKLLKDPMKVERLQQLELSTFAEHLAGAISFTVEDSKALVESIRLELIDHYKDKRPIIRDYKSGQQDVFYLITNETPATMAVNAHVNGEMKAIFDKFSFITLDCGLQGKIDNNEIDNDTLSCIKPGTPIRTSIKSVTYELFQISLETGLKDKTDWQFYAVGDPYGYKQLHFNEVSVRVDSHFDVHKAKEDYEKINKEQLEQQKGVTHSKNSKYKNLDFKSACKYLRSLKDPKDYYVFRPSRNGEGYLNITWKIYKDLYGNIEIQQDYRGQWTLSMDIHQTFKTMEDVVQQYIGRIQDHVNEMCRNGKFVGKNESQTRAALEAMSKRGKSVPYLIHFDYSKSLQCMISYKATPESPVHNVPFRVTHEGFVMDSQKYKRIGNLINDFKRLVSGMPIVGDK